MAAAAAAATVEDGGVVVGVAGGSVGGVPFSGAVQVWISAGDPREPPFVLYYSSTPQSYS